MAFVTGQSSSPPGDVVGSGSGAGQCAIKAVGLAELHRAHCGRLHRFFARHGARQDADDLVQESFVRFAGMQAKSPDKVVDRPEAYLTTIAVNLLRDRAKVADRRSTASHLPAEEVEPVGSDNNTALKARDQNERRKDSLASLTPKSRVVFLTPRQHG